MANIRKTRKITSILKRTDERLQIEMRNDIAQQLADIHCNALIIKRNPSWLFHALQDQQ